MFKKIYIIVFICIVIFSVQDVHADIMDKTNRKIIMSESEYKKIESLDSKGANTAKKLKWKSSNTKIVAIDSNLNIRAIKTGTAKITGSFRGASVTYTIIVKKKNQMYSGISYNKAKKLTLGKTINKYISNLESYKYHWYYVELDKDVLLNLDLLPDSDTNLTIYVYSHDGNKQINYNYGQNVHINLKVPLQKGKYYIIIQNNLNAGNYQLKNYLTNIEKEKDKEGNDSFQKAILLKLNNEIEGHLGFYSKNGKTDDVDWYKIDLEKNAVVNTELIGDPTLSYRIEVYGKDGGTRIFNKYGTDVILNGELPLKRGIYYIKISNESGYGGYKLKNTLQFAPEITEIENNDSFQYANELPMIGKLTGIIGYYDDNGNSDTYDWYKINTFYNEEFDITLVPDADMGGISIVLFDSNGGSQLKRVYGNNEIIVCSKKREENEIMIPKTYYIRVTKDDGYGNYDIFRK